MQPPWSRVGDIGRWPSSSTMDTGMRPGEVYGVRRRDVDLANARVYVRQTVIKLRASALR